MKQITENIWVIPSEVKVAPGVYLPLQSTVIRLSDDTLWLHSPVRLKASDISEIKALGEVAHLVAPNLMHHLFFGDAAQAFPNARTYAAPGLAKKRPDLSFDETLSSDTTFPGISSHFIDGAPLIRETMFIHDAETLISADLFQNNFNPKNWLSKMTCVMAGTHEQVAISRLVQTVVRDKPKFKEGIDQVMSSSFERLIPCHGDIVDFEAKARCRSACNRVNWLL
jgi:hypothetical protein